MKPFYALTTGIAALALASAVLAQDGAAPAAPPAVGLPAAAPAGPTLTDAQLAEELGWFMAKKVGIADLAFSPAEADAMAKGFGAAVAGKDAPYDLQKIGPQLDAYTQKKQGDYIAKLKQQSAAQSEAFFANLKNNKNVIQSPSGLRYEIVREGTGPYPKATDTVKVDYTGTLIDGTVFDTSKQPRQQGGTAEPAEFALDGVIAGWTEGLQKINKGGEIKLYVPANLAYGDDGRSGIPPGSTLIFDIELLDIKPAAAPSGAQLSMPAGK
jgi:FKBP-type peptidyl-prolyl cis-trans isomerase